jgi:hypothetical protein
VAETKVDPASQTADNTTPWFCKNCGNRNAPEASECVRCGFSSTYDPEAHVPVDMAYVHQAVAARSSELQLRLRFYYDIIKNVLLMVVAIYVLLICVRLYHTWPFQSSFERDANALADSVLLMQGRLELGMKKSTYDELLVDLKVKETTFKLKYGESAERERQAYQKLVQSAEYYSIAREAWDKQLLDEGQGRLDSNALSSVASDDVKRYWDTAASNALLAVKDLR